MKLVVCPPKAACGLYACAESRLCSSWLQDRSSDELRAAAAGLLASLCKAGGAVLWGSAGYYAEEALKTAVTALEDAASVRNGSHVGTA